MRLRTPRWWYRRDARARAMARMLAPLGAIWARATARRIARTKPYDPGIPVICVGNLTLGGSGKTPLAMEIARWLAEAGRQPAILASGHGGRLRGPVRVLQGHGAGEVGDEAVLLARAAPTFNARDREAGARAIARAGFEAIVMDDGHQNPFLKKTVSLVVVDGETRDGEWPFGPGGVVPAGPLREPLATGLARATVVVALRPMGVEALNPELAATLGGRPLWTGGWSAGAPAPEGPLLAFAGLAKPWRFFRALSDASGEVVETQAFADHDPFSEAALAGLQGRAEAEGARLITTEKDWTRLPPPWRGRVLAWPARVVIDDETAARSHLLNLCARPRGGVPGRV